MEGYGSGYDRITAACRDGGYPEPEWIENGPQIKVVLRPHPSGAPNAQRARAGGLEDRTRARGRRAPEERRDAILAALDEIERPNTRDLAQHTGISERSLDRDLRALRDAGLVEFVGSRQTGYYRRNPGGRAA
jgi:ATP-dependent DNA helicase RecG